MWYSIVMDDYVHILLDNTAEAAARFRELASLLALPETAADSRYYLHLSREAARLRPFADAHRALSAAALALDKNREEQRTADGELLPLYREEEVRLAAALDAAVAEVQALSGLMAHGGNAPCVLTVREAGNTGFATDVLRLYEHYLELSGIDYKVSPDKSGGTITAEGGLGRLGYEAGLHRRTDGASATVTVMPLPERGEVVVSPEEIRVDIFCSTGKGGQNVNKVETAVRITHLPTGMVVTCQDERSQLMNKRRALATLADRLRQEDGKRRAAAYVQARDDQIRDRSNPIRRYDVAHNVLRDVRTGAEVPLKDAMRGHIEPLIKAIATKDIR